MKLDTIFGDSKWDSLATIQESKPQKQNANDIN
jgi:hypothetical protein